MNTLISINISVFFKQKYEKPPRVKLRKPNTGKLLDITTDSFSFKITVNPKKTRRIEIKYKADFEDFEDEVLLQFCPACLEPLAAWPGFRAVFIAPNGQQIPGIPTGFCPLCGCVFVSKKDLNNIQKQEKSNIILPNVIIK